MRSDDTGADRVERPAGAPGPQGPFLVDSHVHLWDLSLGRYPWLRTAEPGTTAWIGDYSKIRRTYILADYLDDSAGTVQAFVHVEATRGDRDPVAETRWVRSATAEWPGALSIVGRVDLRLPQAAAALDAHLETSEFRGVRMTEMPGLIDDPAFNRGFGLLASRGLSYDLNIRWPEADSALLLARRFPDTSILIDNMANPRSLGEEEFRPWSSAMARLAQAPNVAMKISGLGMADHQWTISSVRPWILAVLDLFGGDRAMFGTNWPVDSLYSSYQDLLGAYISAVSDLTPGEQHALFAGNARRLYQV